MLEFLKTINWKQTIKDLYAAIRIRVIILLIFLFILFVFPLAIIRMLFAIIGNAVKAWNVLKAFDRLGNVLLNGKDTEMISTRAARAKREGRRWGCILCKILNELEKDHCEKSVG